MGQKVWRELKCRQVPQYPLVLKGKSPCLPVDLSSKHPVTEHMLVSIVSLLNIWAKDLNFTYKKVTQFLDFTIRFTFEGDFIFISIPFAIVLDAV